MNVRCDINRSSASRSYAMPAYYCPCAGRPNVHVLAGAQVYIISFVLVGFAMT